MRTQDFNKGSKVAVFLDYNLAGLQPYLQESGYKVETFSGSLGDYDIHLQLLARRAKTKEKPLILVTNNVRDFLVFRPRPYSIISVSADTAKYTVADKLARKVEELIRETQVAGFYENGVYTITRFKRR